MVRSIMAPPPSWLACAHVITWSWPAGPLWIPLVGPCVRATAGGGWTADLGRVQSLQHDFWEQQEVEQRLEKVMSRAFQQVVELAEEKKTTMRKAALLLGISRVVRAIELRGIYP